MYLKWPTLVKCGFLHAKTDNPDILNIPNHLYAYTAKYQFQVYLQDSSRIVMVFVLY